MGHLLVTWQSGYTQINHSPAVPGPWSGLQEHSCRNLPHPIQLEERNPPPEERAGATQRIRPKVLALTRLARPEANIPAVIAADAGGMQSGIAATAHAARAIRSSKAALKVKDLRNGVLHLIGVLRRQRTGRPIHGRVILKTRVGAGAPARQAREQEARARAEIAIRRRGREDPERVVNAGGSSPH